MCLGDAELEAVAGLVPLNWFCVVSVHPSSICELQPCIPQAALGKQQEARAAGTTCAHSSGPPTGKFPWECPSLHAPTGAFTAPILLVAPEIQAA